MGVLKQKGVTVNSVKQTIQVGVVGCGYWGPNLIRNLRQASDCVLKVVCDASEQRLKHMRKLHHDVATTTDFKNLLAAIRGDNKEEYGVSCLIK